MAHKRPKLPLTEETGVRPVKMFHADHAAPANRLQRIGSLDVPPQQSLFTAFGGGPSIFSRIKTTVVPDRNEERGTTSTSLSEQIRNARKMSDGSVTSSSTFRATPSLSESTQACSEDYMTPSDQPVVKPTHQQLQQQVQQRITTMSRVDPTHPTAFDSFSTIVQDLPAGVAILQVNPFLKRVQNGKPPSSQGVPQRAVSRLTREFTDVHVIGTGSFGEVYRGRLKIDGVTYAVKRIRQSLNRSSGVNAIQLQLREVHCLSFLASRCGHCPNILRYFTSWIDPSDQSLYIQTEHCERGNLSRFVRAASASESNKENRNVLNEAQIVEIIRQVCVGLLEMHRNGVAHLDLKPENILETAAGVYKISDFGLCAPMDQTDMDKSIAEGDARYLCAELLNDDYSHLDRADMFALGATALELCLSEPLPSQGFEYRQIRLGLITLDESRFSSQLCQLIRCLLSADPMARPTALDVLTILRTRPAEFPNNITQTQDRLDSALRRIEQLENELQLARSQPCRPTY
ncbi:unnamed protein product (mitochondrion) [Plasmodiophora brassicae]|uniref:Protein kinase domain-containing protein n=2 Tax=Plasmodiophora brassicae TaxID=37360 RepID=A0A3P3YGQ5_PLABS|nr:unnamed protein product [Plasmodiophora brassicae]